jgi:hypothetical protein
MYKQADITFSARCEQEPEPGCTEAFTVHVAIGTYAGRRCRGGRVRWSFGTEGSVRRRGRGCARPLCCAGGLRPSTPRFFVDSFVDGFWSGSEFVVLHSQNSCAEARIRTMSVTERLNIGEANSPVAREIGLGTAGYPCGEVGWTTGLLMCPRHVLGAGSHPSGYHPSYELHIALVSIVTLSTLGRVSIRCLNPRPDTPSPASAVPSSGIPARGEVFWLTTKFAAESATAYRPFWARIPCLAFVFKLPELESFDVMESGEQGAVDCCLQCGAEAKCASWIFAESSCSLHVGIFPMALLSRSGSVVAGVMHSADNLSQLVSPLPRELPGVLVVSSSSERPSKGWVGIPLHDECWERTQRAELFLRLKGGTPWADLGAWHTSLGMLRSLGTKSGDLLLEHVRPSVLCDRIAMCRIGTAVARGLYAMASTTLDALASRGNITSTCSAQLPANPLPISSQMKSFGWRILGIYNHHSIQDLVTTMRDLMGLNITFIGMSSVPSAGCKAYPGSCLKPMWPFLDPNFEADSCNRYGRSHLDRFRRAHTALSGDSLVQNVNAFLCVHPPIYCEYFMTLSKSVFGGSSGGHRFGIGPAVSECIRGAGR